MLSEGSSTHMPHIIRLRGPWNRQRLADGSLRVTRRFHRPTGLDARSRVWLVIEGVEASADVALNERPLQRFECSETVAVDTARPMRFEITDRLQPENVVGIVLQSPPENDSEPGPFGSVRLEIEEGEA